MSAVLNSALAAAETMYTAYIAAETEILLGKTVEVGGRKHDMASLKEVQEGRDQWQRRINSLKAQIAGAPTAGGITFSQANFGN